MSMGRRTQRVAPSSRGAGPRLHDKNWWMADGPTGSPAHRLCELCRAELRDPHQSRAMGVHTRRLRPKTQNRKAVPLLPGFGGISFVHSINPERILEGWWLWRAPGEGRAGRCIDRSSLCFYYRKVRRTAGVFRGIAPSFNGRTAASGAAYRGSNPWGATNV
jgi:hypothetical protein